MLKVASVEVAGAGRLCEATADQREFYWSDGEEPTGSYHTELLPGLLRTNQMLNSRPL